MTPTQLFSDKNAVGLLLLLREESKISSTELLEVNSCYQTAMRAANLLCNAGLVERISAPDHRNKVYWQVTEIGMSMADRIYALERDFRKYLKDGKVL